MFAQAKLVVLLIVVMAALGIYAYVQSLRADLATSEANNATLITTVEQQRQVIDQIQQDVTNGQRLRRELSAAVRQQNREVANLRDRLQNRTDVNGNAVSLSDLATEKLSLVEKKINQGTNNAYRCMEIASGATLTEKEINAKKPNEINPECPNLANPNYQP
jgi:membrane-associated HD superfamily phosphohydrolase